MYLPNKFNELQTWLVEVVHIVNRVNLQTIAQWNWMVWALVNTISNQAKVAKRALLPENAGKIHPDHLLLVLLKTDIDIGNARYTLQGIIATQRYPEDQVMPPTLSQMTSKYPKTLLIFQLVAMCHQHTIHHHTSTWSYLTPHSYLEPSKKLK